MFSFGSTRKATKKTLIGALSTLDGILDIVIEEDIKNNGICINIINKNECRVYAQDIKYTITKDTIYYKQDDLLLEILPGNSILLTLLVSSLLDKNTNLSEMNDYSDIIKQIKEVMTNELC